MRNTNPNHVAQCRCAAVEIGAWSEPLVVTACYCNDCQAASERLAATANSAPLAGADGGTEFMVFRRDRIACTRGAGRLEAMRLTDATKTRRMIAGCCATPMYVSFDDKRPWVSAFRARFGAGAPPVEMRICTRFRRSDDKAIDGLPEQPRLSGRDDPPRPGRLAAHAVQPADWRLALIRAPDRHGERAKTVVFGAKSDRISVERR